MEDSISDALAEGINAGLSGQLGDVLLADPSAGSTVMAFLLVAATQLFARTRATPQFVRQVYLPATTVGTKSSTRTFARLLTMRLATFAACWQLATTTR